ncbi:hypothetical protein B0H14DRAFT_3880000 [Mycena olivaceomarginata]|nr:hypothetical protein B0H14DRAFT_3880000 [Mycena olivaceomarginata]
MNFLQVLELKNLNVPAFPYCHETVTEARIAGRNLVHEIRDCKTWNIICVDPEHLREKAWRQISAFTSFVRISCMDVPTTRTLSTHGVPSFARSSGISAPQRNYAGVQTPLWTLHCIPDIPHWHRGRVCLVGDAAHALPPNGQGSAMAFEDAAYLARLLGAHPLDAPRDVARVFAQFERNRRPRIERVRALAHGTGGAKGGTAAG